MIARRRHRRRRRASSGGSLRIDDGRVTGTDECRVVIRSDDGTIVSPMDGREVLKSRLHGGFKAALATLAIAAILILGIPLGMALVKLSLVVLRR